MDYIPSTIYFKDRQSKFTKINKAQAETIGIANPDEAIGKTHSDYFPVNIPMWLMKTNKSSWKWYSND